MEQLFKDITVIKLEDGITQNISDEEIATITNKEFQGDEATKPFRILKEFSEGDYLLAQTYLLIELNPNHSMVETVFMEPSKQCVFWIDQLDNSYLYYKFKKNDCFDQISYKTVNEKLRNKIKDNPYIFTIKSNYYGVDLYTELLEYIK